MGSVKYSADHCNGVKSSSIYLRDEFHNSFPVRHRSQSLKQQIRFVVELLNKVHQHAEIQNSVSLLSKSWYYCHLTWIFRLTSDENRDWRWPSELSIFGCHCLRTIKTLRSRPIIQELFWSSSNLSRGLARGILNQMNLISFLPLEVSR